MTHSQRAGEKCATTACMQYALALAAANVLKTFAACGALLQVLCLQSSRTLLAMPAYWCCPQTSRATGRRQLLWRTCWRHCCRSDADAVLRAAGAVCHLSISWQLPWRLCELLLNNCAATVAGFAFACACRTRTPLLQMHASGVPVCWPRCVLRACVWWQRPSSSAAVDSSSGSSGSWLATLQVCAA